LRDVFEEFFRRQARDEEISTHSIRRGDAEIRLRQAGICGNPIVIADVSEEFGLDAVEFKAFKKRHQARRRRCAQSRRRGRPPSRAPFSTS